MVRLAGETAQAIGTLLFTASSKLFESDNVSDTDGYSDLPFNKLNAIFLFSIISHRIDYRK